MCLAISTSFDMSLLSLAERLLFLCGSVTLSLCLFLGCTGLLMKSCFQLQAYVQLVNRVPTLNTKRPLNICWIGCRVRQALMQLVLVRVIPSPRHSRKVCPLSHPQQTKLPNRPSVMTMHSLSSVLALQFPGSHHLLHHCLRIRRCPLLVLLRLVRTTSVSLP